MLLASNSTDSLLNSFPMFGHPGISALEYAGQLDKMREQSTKTCEVSLKCKSPSLRPDVTTSPVTTEVETTDEEVETQLHFIDEFECQQRRRGTFINHTPRKFEMRSSKHVDMHPSSRAGSENYSRPLSRQSSRASASPVINSHRGQSFLNNSSAHEQRTIVVAGAAEEDKPRETGVCSPPDIHASTTTEHRRSFSAPLGPMLIQPSAATTTSGRPSRESSLRSTSLLDHRGQESKRQRRQTPFKIVAAKQVNIPRHASMEPLVAEHRRKGTNDTIGDVPFDMDRELSAEFGTFGVIQRYFDSQGGGPVLSSTFNPEDQLSGTSGSSLPSSLEPSTHKPFIEPIAIYPIDELNLSDEAPPVPDRSPKRLTNPSFPVHKKSVKSTDSDFNFAAQGDYCPYEKDEIILDVPKKRVQARPPVAQPWAASANSGKLAPTILGHAAQVASSDLRLNELSNFLKHTGPSPEPPVSAKQRKKKGMGLFKVKQRKTLAARVGSVEGSPQRARTRPSVPACTQEMTTSSGAKHLKIIIPPDSPTNSQLIGIPTTSKQRTQRRSRYVSISFTEEMLNPLASPEVERMISKFETSERSVSTPTPRSPRSPKRSPRASKPIPVKDHPLATREEQTRARKLRDLERIKRKPVPTRTHLEQQEDTAAGGMPTPAHTPKPVTSTTHNDEGIEEENADDNVGRLQDRVISLQRQNTQLAEALAKLVGLELEGGNLESEDVLKAARQLRSRTPSV